METSKEILKELQETAPFLGKEGLSRVPYTLPAGYFEGFTEILMKRIQTGHAGFSEPESGRELAEISPLLVGLQKKNTYQVPEGFFESWKAKIPAVETNPSKGISMPSMADHTNSRPSPIRRISIPMRMVRYAAAACIIALLGTTVFNLIYHRNITDPITSLNSVSDQDMANYMDADDIHWTPGLTSSAETASVEFSDNDIHELLGSVPDDELEQYFPALPEQKRTVN
jgi:hypothetical protein